MVHNESAGNATVTLRNAGECIIAASQLGAGQYDPAEDVERRFTILPAPMAVRPSSPRIIYDGTVPQITPIYTGFVNGDHVSALDIQATCATTAPSNGRVGNYETNCSGAADANYRFTYVPGTLTILPARTELALTAAPGSVVRGQPVTVTATVTLLLSGGTPGGTVEFKTSPRASVVPVYTTIGDCAAQPVNGSTKTAACTTSSLRVGTHRVIAAYSGDANVIGSTAPTVTLTVNKASTSTTLGAAANSSSSGTQVTLTAVVGVVAPGAGAPTGKVTFFDGAKALGTGELSVVNGQVLAAFTPAASPWDAIDHGQLRRRRRLPAEHQRCSDPRRRRGGFLNHAPPYRAVRDYAVPDRVRLLA